MHVERLPDALPSDASRWRSVLGDCVERLVGWIADLIDPVGWAIEIIGGLLDLLA